MGWERWRRVPEPGACDFCLMLATRGAVYASQSTAGKDNDYHAHCHCDQESEGNFDARTDVRISLTDARNEVEFYHERSGYSYSYDLSRFRNAGVTDVPGVPEWELGLKATAEEVALRSATIERKLTDLLFSEQTPWVKARIARLAKEDDLLARREVLRPQKTTPTFRRGPLAEPKPPKVAKAKDAAQPVATPEREVIRLRHDDYASKSAQFWDDYLQQRRAALDARRAHDPNDPYIPMIEGDIARISEQRARVSAAMRPGESFTDAIPLDAAPKPISEAASGANPGYGSDKAFGVNCVHCAHTYELRRRGFDAVATPLPDDLMKAGKHGRSSREAAMRWVDAAGKPGNELNISGIRQLREVVGSWPEGARGWVHGQWKGGMGGHIISVENVGGKVVLVDPQIGVITEDAKAVSAYIGKWKKGSVMLTRSDVLEPTDLVSEFMRGGTP